MTATRRYPADMDAAVTALGARRSLSRRVSVTRGGQGGNTGKVIVAIQPDAP